METQLAHVKLTDIAVSDTNVMFRDEAEMTQEALQELIDSIREKGVIQPVLLRPTKKTPESKTLYELICGERRFRASSFIAVAFKDRDTIPAYIREMTDEEAFELQVTENLQRKDVHPLKEAKAYKYLMEKDTRITAGELALRFGKSEHYVLTRLKLNDLVPEAKKAFTAGKMILNQALVIARLEPHDQKEVLDECQSYEGYFDPASEIESYIDRSIMCNLSSAAFKKDDATLNPSMGPCTTCQFRTGANQLFADIKNKDRCLNRSCFETKKDAHLARVLQKTIEEKPDIVLLQTYNSGDKIATEVKKIIDAHKLKPLKNYTDFDTDKWGNPAPIKGLWINGDKAGSFATVYSKKEKAAKGEKAATQSSLELDIARIEERTSRAAELDDDKVYQRIVDTLAQHPTQLNVYSGINFTDAEHVLLKYLLYDLVQHDLEDDELKALKLPEEFSIDEDKEKEKLKFYNRLAALNMEEQTFLLRRLMMKKYCSGSHLRSRSVQAFIIRKVAESYKDVALLISDFETEQADIRFKREQNASKRISKLKAEAAEAKKPKKRTKTPDQEKNEKYLDDFVNMDIGKKSKKSKKQKTEA